MFQLFIKNIRKRSIYENNSAFEWIIRQNNVTGNDNKSELFAKENSAFNHILIQTSTRITTEEKNQK